MSPQQDTPVADIRTRLRGLTHELEHLLPAQAPIRDFVHHNTLHGFQHLPFREALVAARELNGQSAWMPEATSREFYRSGRIDDADLEQALASLPEFSGAEAAAFRELDRIALIHGAEALNPQQLAWEIAENAALERVQPDLAPEARRRLLGDRPEAEVLAALWEACGEMLAAPAGDADSRCKDLATTAEARLDALWQGLGSRLTRRGLLLALTGEDLMDDLRPMLVRSLAAHLDHGVAAWASPQRPRGLFAAWRAEALSDPRRAMAEGTELRSLAAQLPDDGLEALLQLLPLTGLDEALWPGYLTRLALELPGWAGMTLWRSQRPGYDTGSPQVPVDLLDYLALHLAGEQLVAARCVGRHWSLRPRTDLLRWYFRHHPAEAVVRLARFAGSLDEALADAAEQLIVIGRQPPENDAPEWVDLAARILAAPASGSDQRWPLFRLAQHLGLPAAALRQLGNHGVRAMLRRLDWLDADRRGEIWLLAYEHHYRRQILAVLHANRARQAPPEPVSAQLLFCMDDREEGMRRHLEETAPSVRTYGAAGFFGIAMRWTGIDDERGTALCPVVVTPAHAVHEVPAPGHETALVERRRRRRLRLAARRTLFQRSRLRLLPATLISVVAAIPALAALGAKLLAPNAVATLARRLGAGFDRPLPTRSAFTAPADAAPASPGSPRDGFTDAEQADRLAAILRTIGLVGDFAPLVVIAGHGSHSLNNPHRSAYDCGACSGRHGGPNARVVAAIANRPEIRQLLVGRGITIPATSFFVACEHDTGDDSFSWYDLDLLPDSHQPALARLRAELGEAGRRHARERCRRFASAPADPAPEQALRHVAARSDDFSQARPELGHVTNACAVIGRRSMTRGSFLDRRAFLISYDPTLDPEGSILEAILLAAGPVGAGISLEYYFSTVNNDGWGCSSKVMHNLAGLLGVMEGASSDLRTGLPRQMIEIHEAMRLLIVCEALPDTLTRIVERQPALQELVGKAWVQIAAQEPENGQLHIYVPGRGWEAWTPSADELPRVSRSDQWFAGEWGALPPALVGSDACA